MISRLDRLQGRDIYENTALAKINELVEFCNDIGNARWFLERHEEQITKLNDAVNELQENQNTYWTDIAEIKKELQTRAENVQPDAESRPENVQDKFAEQRKCICKLCWFWNDDKADKVIGILTGVFDEADKPFERSINQTLYKHCEPVFPDDDIIYKGE